LEERLNEFSGDAKKAFSNLEENPIWLNKEKGISIKRVAVKAISNGEPLHKKKDKDGNALLDPNGNPQWVDFVSPDNNHHVAIYKDRDGKLQDVVVTFWEAVSRKTQGMPLIEKDYKKDEGWEFLFSMKKNEYFAFPNETTGFDPKAIDLMDPDNYASIVPNLFRVQTISRVTYGNQVVRDYKFRHHLETMLIDNVKLRGFTYQQHKSLTFAEHIVKVRVNHIGSIVSVGEY
jgi:CRISPR-associated endonuclease Csn1